MQSQIRDVLFARPASAVLFLNRVGDGQFDAKTVPVEQLRRLGLAPALASRVLDVSRYSGDLLAGGKGEILTAA